MTWSGASPCASAKAPPPPQTAAKYAALQLFALFSAATAVKAGEATDDVAALKPIMARKMVMRALNSDTLAPFAAVQLLQVYLPLLLRRDSDEKGEVLPLLLGRRGASLLPALTERLLVVLSAVLIGSVEARHEVWNAFGIRRVGALAALLLCPFSTAGPNPPADIAATSAADVGRCCVDHWEAWRVLLSSGLCASDGVNGVNDVNARTLSVPWGDASVELSCPSTIPEMERFIFCRCTEELGFAEPPPAASYGNITVVRQPHHRLRNRAPFLSAVRFALLRYYIHGAEGAVSDPLGPAELLEQIKAAFLDYHRLFGARDVCVMDLMCSFVPVENADLPPPLHLSDDIIARRHEAIAEALVATLRAELTSLRGRKKRTADVKCRIATAERVLCGAGGYDDITVQLATAKARDLVANITSEATLVASASTLVATSVLLLSSLASTSSESQRLKMRFHALSCLEEYVEKTQGVSDTSIVEKPNKKPDKKGIRKGEEKSGDSAAAASAADTNDEGSVPPSLLCLRLLLYSSFRYPADNAVLQIKLRPLQYESVGYLHLPQVFTSAFAVSPTGRDDYSSAENAAFSLAHLQQNAPWDVMKRACTAVEHDAYISLPELSKFYKRIVSSVLGVEARVLSLLTSMKDIDVHVEDLKTEIAQFFSRKVGLLSKLHCDTSSPLVCNGDGTVLLHALGRVGSSSSVSSCAEPGLDFLMRDIKALQSLLPRSTAAVTSGVLDSVLTDARSSFPVNLRGAAARAEVAWVRLLVSLVSPSDEFGSSAPELFSSLQEALEQGCLLPTQAAQSDSPSWPVLHYIGWWLVVAVSDVVCAVTAGSLPDVLKAKFVHLKDMLQLASSFILPVLSRVDAKEPLDFSVPEHLSPSYGDAAASFKQRSGIAILLLDEIAGFLSVRMFQVRFSLLLLRLSENYETLKVETLVSDVDKAICSFVSTCGSKASQLAKKINIEDYALASIGLNSSELLQEAVAPVGAKAVINAMGRCVQKSLSRSACCFLSPLLHVHMSLLVCSDRHSAVSTQSKKYSISIFG